MTEIKQDILANTRGVIVHQVNCMHKMGSGLALAIKERYPKAYSDYMAVPEWKLGMAVFSQVGPELFIGHLAGQQFYGRDPGRCYTDYAALERSIAQAVAFASEKQLPLLVPYKIGCGLAGGNWELVRQMLQRVAPTATVCVPPVEALQRNQRSFYRR